MLAGLFCGLFNWTRGKFEADLTTVEVECEMSFEGTLGAFGDEAVK